MTIPDPDRLERECATWPAGQAETWRTMFALSDRWAEMTRRGRARAWTQFLGHCRAGGMPLSLTQAGVASFAAACHGRGVGLRTFATYARDLQAVTRVLEPKNSALPWLAERIADVERPAQRAPKRKRGVLAEAPQADELYAAVIARLHEAADALDGIELGAFAGARSLPSHIIRPLTRYRAALLTGLALACPERRSALAAVEVTDFDLVRQDVVYRGPTTKPGRGHTAPVPPELIAPIECWLEWRQAFRPPHRGLWLSFAPGAVARRAGGDVVYDDIQAVTKELGGQRLWPHLLRDLAAGLARSRLAELPRLASDVLDHRDERTVQVYVEHARRTLDHHRAQQRIAEAVAGAGARARANAAGKGRAALERRHRRRRRSRT